MIDTGSELSFIDQKTARSLERLRFMPTADHGQVRLADGTQVSTTGTIRVLLNLSHRVTWHTFRILPQLDNAMIIVMDVWAGSGIILRPPPPYSHTYGTTPTKQSCPISEDEQLRVFLEEEVRKFDHVRGPTELTEPH
ncbi:hypothetical protein P5V15_014359 [Pogonomyrmex californicus]